MRKVIAVLCSDIHLSQAPPIARAGEVWYEAMAASVGQLVAIKETYDAPVICAGDVFDKWKSPPELINFALEHLPEMWAIPGQHDLPYHSYEDIHKSAFHTLVEAGKLRLLPKGGATQIQPGLIAHSFPWGEAVTPCPTSDHKAVNLAVVHAYIWTSGNEYHGAPVTKTVGAFKKALKGYDAAVFGDNHKGFLAKAGKCNVANTGGFMRRTADQANYQPFVALLHDDGTITRQDIVTEDLVDTSHLELGPPVSENVRAVDAFMDEIRKADDKGTSFEDALHRYLKSNKVKKGVRRKLEESINGK